MTRIIRAQNGGAGHGESEIARGPALKSRWRGESSRGWLTADSWGLEMDLSLVPAYP